MLSTFKTRGRSDAGLNLGVRLDKEDRPSYDTTTGFQGISFGGGDKVAPRLGRRL